MKLNQLDLCGRFAPAILNSHNRMLFQIHYGLMAKPGKDSKDPNNYHPIAWTSCVCKTMERMINDRLVWYLESSSLITEAQSGFRKTRSTMDHLVRFETFVREGFLNRELWQAFHANNHYLQISKIHLRISEIHLRISKIHLWISEIHLRISVNNFRYPKFIFQYPKIR